MAGRSRAAAGGDRDRGLRRHGGAVQLQRPRAALLPALGAAPGRRPGQPRAEGRAQPPRHAIARAARPLLEPIARAVRRARQGRRGAARAAGALDAGRRDLRPGRRRPPAKSRGRCATSSRQTEGVVDVDWYVESPREKVGLPPRPREGGPLGDPRGRRRARRCASPCRPTRPGEIHLPDVREPDSPARPLPDGAPRTTSAALGALSVRGRRRPPRAARARSGASSACRPTTSIYHKNLQPVIYVTADVAGAARRPSTRSRRSRRASREIAGAGRVLASRRARRPRPSTRRATGSSGTASGTSRTRSSATSASPSPSCWS